MPATIAEIGMDYRKRYFIPSNFESARKNKTETGDREVAFYSRWGVEDFLNTQFPQIGKGPIGSVLKAFHVKPTELQIFSTNEQPGFFAMQASGFVKFEPDNADMTLTFNVLPKKTKRKKEIPVQEITISSVHKKNIYSGVYESSDGGNSYSLARIGVSHKSESNVQGDDILDLSVEPINHSLGAITKKMIELAGSSKIAIYDGSKINQEVMSRLKGIPIAFDASGVRYVA